MAENDIAIEVRNVTKSFKVYLDKGAQLKERLLFRKRSRYEERKVLRGISFDVKKGEAIGLIGHNGCGKSTTLKLLTRIMYPDEGTIKLKGRVSSLIELGAGFHPDMSGRENIYTNAAIFGLTKKEIDARIKDIVDFSELAEFIDNPVRTYSSGMYMRLAFSVAINVDADVLLIDEILAVGDANFQTKCFNKLKEIKAQGTTIVIVSHALGQIEQICDRAIWIHEGLIKAEGPPKEIDLEYLDYMSRKMQEKNKSESDAEEVSEEETGKRWGSGEVRIKKVRSFAADGSEQKTFRTGEDIRLSIDYTVKKPVKDAVFGFGVFDMNGIQCYGTNTRIDKQPDITISESGTAEILMKNVELLAGEYNIDIAIEQGEGIPIDYFRQAYRIQMISAMGDVGVSRIEHTWKLKR
ncbi:ABC transporter ATP-binding protein [Ruminococcus flavefaciens]|uniref:ABC-2 type transport system ATP-binding protein n=1 Tax=Ruminococcus flavefaciens TaxID=1265 RepID=A0A1K1N1T6_RUMFL|nr:ABC transporter ATP-binding protein [Ruminococcus flavefaciens]SFW29295.1 ABC-2 type transport system ATP-binding protein [Ruminococcus flavefaciens]